MAFTRTHDLSVDRMIDTVKGVKRIAAKLAHFDGGKRDSWSTGELATAGLTDARRIRRSALLSCFAPRSRSCAEWSLCFGGQHRVAIQARSQVASARRGDLSPIDQLWPKGSWKLPWRCVPHERTCSSIGDPRVAPADRARARSSSGSSTNSSIRVLVRPASSGLVSLGLFGLISWRKNGASPISSPATPPRFQSSRAPKARWYQAIAPAASGTMSITEIAVPDPVVRLVSLERESFVTQPVCTMEH